ncbi:MAG: septal ring lytic transglycosylase RlpA family protein [Planctomycetota bacterium]|jgi:rare lipoprotein A
MYIFQKKMRIRGYLILCIGFMCLIGCQGAYVRDTNVSNKTDNGNTSIKETGKIEAKSEEIKMRRLVIKDADKTNTGETVDKENDLSSKNILEEVPIKVADKRKNNDEKTALYDETGVASFISDEYDGRMTASGVRYDGNKMTAAHPSLPFDTKVLVTNLRNKRTVEVIIIDRFTPTNDRILNVSNSAAIELDLVESGIAKIGIKIISSP